MVFGRTLVHRFVDTAAACSRKIRGNAGVVGNRSSILRQIIPESGCRGLQIQAAATKGWKWGVNVDGFRAAVVTVPSMLPRPVVDVEEGERWGKGVLDEKLRMTIMVSQMEMAKSRLKQIPKMDVEFSEFLRICRESSNEEQGMELARSLEKYGTVIVHGKVVFLRPDLMTRSIQNALPLTLTPPNDPRRKELREMEVKKSKIDRDARSRVRREQWSGLGFLAAQTGIFFRLTFWEMSWDVMEPICFYVTSLYFLAGYVFFLRTSTEPSFEGFFNSRFETKQKQLMKQRGFDLSRFNELRRLSSGK